MADLHTLTDSERIDWLRLTRTPNIGPVTFAQLLKRYGSPAAALDALPDLAKRSGRKRPLLAPDKGLIEKEIEALCQEQFQESYHCLRSIPGIGPVTASVLLAETQALRYFHDAKQLTAYTGIAPKPNESGNTKLKSSISKIGNKYIRRAFYLATLKAAQHHTFKDFYQRILKRSNSTKLARIALARKLLVIAFSLVKSNQLFDPDLMKTRT